MPGIGEQFTVQGSGGSGGGGGLASVGVGSAGVLTGGTSNSILFEGAQGVVTESTFFRFYTPQQLAIIGGTSVPSASWDIIGSSSQVGLRVRQSTGGGNLLNLLDNTTALIQQFTTGGFFITTGGLSLGSTVNNFSGFSPPNLPIITIANTSGTPTGFELVGSATNAVSQTISLLFTVRNQALTQEVARLEIGTYSTGVSGEFVFRPATSSGQVQTVCKMATTGITIAANTSVHLVGFFGAAPVTRQTGSSGITNNTTIGSSNQLLPVSFSTVGAAGDGCDSTAIASNFSTLLTKINTLQAAITALGLST